MPEALRRNTFSTSTTRAQRNGVRLMATIRFVNRLNRLPGGCRVVSGSVQETEQPLVVYTACFSPPVLPPEGGLSQLKQLSLGSLYHMPWLEYRHATPDGRAVLRLRTGRDEFERVTALVANPYNFPTHLRPVGRLN